MQLTHDKPALGTPFREIAVPDPIRWSNAPEMPPELDASGKASGQGLFRQASQSVYWVVQRSASWGQEARTAYGSAVAISENSALTNCHVVAGADAEIVIGSTQPAEQDSAELVAADFEADRCVLKVRHMQLRPVAGMRRADTLEIGEPVYAIGNPRGLELTLSDGLLSGKRLQAERRLLQITAPISPGSSGGGLFDSRGNLIGITTSTLRGAQNINFALPAEDFWR
jgi:S1-C subfamily serine protease